MTIKQLQKVMDLNDDQYVRINDQRNHRMIESSEGWCFDIDYDYDGYNYEEVERILALRVSSCKFTKYSLVIWAY